MKKPTALAAALGLSLGLLAVPAVAQQSPTGQSSGGPARDANPGVGSGMSEAAPTAAPARKMSKKKMKRTGAKRRAPKQPM